MTAEQFPAGNTTQLKPHETVLHCLVCWLLPCLLLSVIKIMYMYGVA
jgi:hypothetical protein